MLAVFGVVIVVGFMTLIMTKRASPFVALVLVPLVVGILTGIPGRWGYDAGDMPTFALAGIVGNNDLDISGVASTAIMLLFAILFFGLMLTAGLFAPVTRLILKLVHGDPLRLLVGTAVLALLVSVDGDGSTTTLVVCSALIPVYRRLNMRMMDLAVIIILGNSIMNLLPWGGPTARIIAALGVDEGELMRRILPGMVLAAGWVIIVAVLRGRAERKRLGICDVTAEELQSLHSDQDSGDELSRHKLIWFNLILTLVMMVILIFGGTWVIPKVHGSVIFAVGFAIALAVNYCDLKDQREIVEKYGASALHVVIMVLAAGVFMGVLNATGMSAEMGRALSDGLPDALGSHWAFVTALVSAPGTFLLSNDAFYLGVLPVLNEVGAANGFEAMDIAVASTAGQAFHLLSPLVGFIYLLLHLTGVEMGAWQRKSATWAIGTFLIFLACMFTVGGVNL